MVDLEQPTLRRVSVKADDRHSLCDVPVAFQAVACLSMFMLFEHLGMQKPSHRVFISLTNPTLHLLSLRFY